MIPDRIAAASMVSQGDHFAFDLTTASPLYKGKLLAFGSRFYAIESYERLYDHPGPQIHYRGIAIDTAIVYDPKRTEPLCTPQDAFFLHAGEILNYPAGPDLDTTIGIFLANVAFLVYPFGDKIPYLNEEFTGSKLEKRITPGLLDGSITPADVKDKYVNTLSLFGHSTEIICPNITEKTISIPPSIGKLRERLVAENKAALEAGDASVMSDIEHQLIAAYKEHLAGDPSMHFLLKSKMFNVVLKKLFLTQGMTEIFGSPGKFTFVDNPMGNGWKIKDLPVIFNEVRKGSYSRAVETADGGVIAKLILRVFQDTLIDSPDCGTTQGEVVDATTGALKEFINNYIVNTDGSTTLLTEENVKAYGNRSDVIVRTPGYCQDPHGFCSKCFGYIFETLGQKAFAPVANEFPRFITVSSLKAMHGLHHSVTDVSDLNRFILS